MEQRGHAEFDSFDHKVRQGRMIKPFVDLQELRRRIYRKAKAEKTWRFWGLYVHVTRAETLRWAYQEAKANDGAPGLDGMSFEDIEAQGVEKFLAAIGQELLTGTYQPTKNRRVEIPKDNGKTRKLGIPTIKDRVVQGAVKLILEPIFEADFYISSFAYRPRRTAHQALDRVVHGLVQGLTQVIDMDLKSYFDNIRHHHLLQKLAKRIEDPAILHLVKQILKANGKKGVPQGGVLSPLLANLYLNDLDKAMEEEMVERRREGKWERVIYTRYADDMVVLVDGYPQWRPHVEIVRKRLQEELKKVEVEINEEKTRVVDYASGGSFGFLGFDLREGRNRFGKRFVLRTPMKKKQSELVRRVGRILKFSRHRKLSDVLEQIRPVIVGWVNYFRVGNARRAFGWIRFEMMRKIRRFAMKQKGRRGCGWKRWSNETIYKEWGLVNNYTVQYFYRSPAKVLPAR
ncbi:MAG TPA: group II intron reverse transcriptase/maturase [Anaerolineales bacterium]